MCWGKGFYVTATRDFMLPFLMTNSHFVLGRFLNNKNPALWTLKM